MSTKWTECDQKAVKNLRDDLFNIVEELKVMFKMEEVELKYQKSLARNLWVLSQRYQILEKGTPDISPYPDFAVKLVMSEMLSEWQANMHRIHKSNNKLREHFKYITPLYVEFDKKLKKYDWSEGVGLLEGDEIFKPLVCFITEVADLMNMFRKNIVERKTLEDLLDMDHPVTIEAYEGILSPPESYKDSFAKAVVFSSLMKPVN